MYSLQDATLETVVLVISDPARCSYSGGARGVGGLTCGLELELKLSDRTGVKNKHF